MTFWPLMSPISGNMTLPTPVYILLMVLTCHMSLVNLRKKGVELPQKIKEINILGKSLVFNEI